MQVKPSLFDIFSNTNKGECVSVLAAGDLQNRLFNLELPNLAQAYFES